MALSNVPWEIPAEIPAPPLEASTFVEVVTAPYGAYRLMIRISDVVFYQESVTVHKHGAECEGVMVHLRNGEKIHCLTTFDEFTRTLDKAARGGQ